MVVGIVGVPPRGIMMKHIEAGDRLVDLDEPIPGFPLRDEFLPNAFCAILKRVVSNVFSLRATGQLDIVLATVGRCKCDGMRNIACWLENSSGVPVVRVENENSTGAGHPICTSGLPLIRKMELIVGSIFEPLPEGVDFAEVKPRCGFWGVPPFDFDILKLFPDDTHIYGWTRCMENGTPADIALECHVDPDTPTVFFTQSFCQKAAIALNLAKEHGGLYVEMDRIMSRSTRAKIEAFLEFNVYRRFT